MKKIFKTTALSILFILLLGMVGCSKTTETNNKISSCYIRSHAEILEHIKPELETRIQQNLQQMIITY